MLDKKLLEFLSTTPLSKIKGRETGLPFWSKIREYIIAIDFFDSYIQVSFFGHEILVMSARSLRTFLCGSVIPERSDTSIA